MIISKKHNMYEFHCELPKDLKILGNNGRSGKPQNLSKLSPSSQYSFHN